MKKLALAILPLFTFGQSPDCYWQQEVNYVMDIDFNVANDQFTGTQQLNYTNNSPDTLREVYYHLYYNAFQPGSMMDIRSLNLPDPDKRVGERISKLKDDEIGYHRINQLSQDGEPIGFEITQTILKARLNQPLPPGESTVLAMEFESQVPVQIRRTGRHNAEGIDYTMTQWYPKLAAYDEDGWHPDPYVAREFYADFGSFDITISIDDEYRLGGTGILQNEGEYWETGTTIIGATRMNYKKTGSDRRSWNFKAEGVHDFAWAADESYQRLRFPGPDDLELNFYYLSKYDSTWENLPEPTARFFELMNARFGRYPYQQFSVIQGGDGGMEYPMSTMLKGTGKMAGLIGVMVHEAAHSWYHGVLASNENQYPWMDEGFTSFAEEEVLNLMGENPVVNPHLQAYRNYLFLVQQEELEPLSTPSDYFTRNRTYGISAYSRGELFLNQLRYIVGEEDFNKGMLTYYHKWGFKHPDPWDFLRVMEQESGLQLDWYLNFSMNTLKTVDYGIKEVLKEGKDITRIELERIGEMPMPVDVTVVTKQGEEITYSIPLLSMLGHKKSEMVLPVSQPWPWTNPSYTLSLPISFKDVKEVIIDRYNFTTDVNLENNSYKISSR